MSEPYYEDATISLHHGDCLNVLRTLPDASVDAVVTDPPYGLEFMGKEWDAPWKADGTVLVDPAEVGGFQDGNGGNPFSRSRVRFGIGPGFQAWCQLWATECLRVLKPGGHLISAGGSRTYHRMTSGVEDAGFEIRDCITWHFGSGFPKSLRVDRDERFCHCDATADTSSRTSRETPPDAHTRTEVDEAATGREERSGHHGTQTALDSLGDCHAGYGSDDAPPHPAPAADLASVPSLEGALGRTRSDAPEDGRDAAASRIPSPAPRSDHPSSQGYPNPSTVPSSPCDDTYLSSREPSRTDSDNGLQAPDTQRKGASLSAWPHCLTCGKPQAKGWGTALKPATEFFVVARKPLAGNVAANVLAHGTGALNVDGCRVGDGDDRASGGLAGAIGYHGGGSAGQARPAAGRWPANVVLDESQAEALDAMSGTQRDGSTRVQHGFRSEYVNGEGSDAGLPPAGYGGEGGASRFYFTAKASSDERPRIDGVAHATVKPLTLTRWLVRLVTQPGGVVLEPFAGSGTTVEACILEGFRCIAIEREADYLPLIVQRINRRRDPVAAVKASGEDPGLFDLLGGDVA